MFCQKCRGYVGSFVDKRGERKWYRFCFGCRPQCEIRGCWEKAVGSSPFCRDHVKNGELLAKLSGFR